MSFSHASDGPDFDTDLSLEVNQLTLDRSGKFDLARFQRPVESSQLLAAHRRGPQALRSFWLAALLYHFEYSSVARFKYGAPLEIA